jgi:hypothetical protein
MPEWDHHHCYGMPNGMVVLVVIAIVVVVIVLAELLWAAIHHMRIGHALDSKPYAPLHRYW